MIQAVDGDLYRLFARLLEYPKPGMAGLVSQVIAKLEPSSPKAADLLSSFLQFVEQASPEQIEEIYIKTFDLQGVCCLYVGHYLFGETYKRSWFMSRLNREYRFWSYSFGNELPDYIPVVLGFLALGHQYEFSQTLLDEGLIPSMKKISDELSENIGNPFLHVIQAILLVLCEQDSQPLNNLSGPGSGEN